MIEIHYIGVESPNSGLAFQEQAPEGLTLEKVLNKKVADFAQIGNGVAVSYCNYTGNPVLKVTFENGGVYINAQSLIPTQGEYFSTPAIAGVNDLTLNQVIKEYNRLQNLLY